MDFIGYLNQFFQENPEQLNTTEEKALRKQMEFENEIRLEEFVNSPVELPKKIQKGNN
ncbi:MAG: hypothetical protein PVJ67_04060 [Candidatus Pacearchaeota archaeon]|jgi:hypothetical protein